MQPAPYTKAITPTYIDASNGLLVAMTRLLEESKNAVSVYLGSCGRGPMEYQHQYDIIYSQCTKIHAGTANASPDAANDQSIHVGGATAQSRSGGEVEQTADVQPLCVENAIGFAQGKDRDA